MLNLLAKDFKLLFGDEKSTSKKVIAALISLIFIACFVAIEVFLFTTILKKVSQFNNAPLAFINLFLAIISILIIFVDIFQANKLLFNQKDIEQLSTRPVSNTAIITSKLIFLFFNHYITSIIFVYPLFISYGIMFEKGIWFYYTGIFYPILSFAFEGGLALILVYPFYLCKKFLNKHLITRFIICLLILFAGCFLYSKVLYLFMSLVASNNVNTLFTTESINKFIAMQKYEFPTNFLVSIFVEKTFSNNFSFFIISSGIALCGCSTAIFAYNYVRSVSVNEKTKKKEHTYKLTSVIKALIKKELSIISKNESYTFSFTGLLIVQPFLAYMIISSLNKIFRTGVFAYYISVVPNFIPLIDILLLMLFTVIIASGACQYIGMESKTIKVIKTIPVKVSTQLTIKVAVPFSFSVISLLITLIVLLVTNIISFSTFAAGFILTISLLLIYCLASLREELNIKHGTSRSNFLSSMYSYLLPITYFIISAMLSYFRLNIMVAYLIGFLTILILGLPQIIYLSRKAKSLFIDLDMVN